MYKSASDGRQRALHHGRYADWVNGQEFQNIQGRYESLRSALRQIELKLAGELNAKERKQLGVRKAYIQDEITELKAFVGTKKRLPQSVAQHFVQSAKDMLAPGHFKTILAVAQSRYDESIPPEEEAPAGATPLMRRTAG